MPVIVFVIQPRFHDDVFRSLQDLDNSLAAADFSRGRLSDFPPNLLAAPA